MLSDRFLHALRVAFELHATQKRKGSNTPYIAHLLAVASLVIEYGGSEEEAIAALLHDAVEDQGGATTLDMIQREFGNRIASIVSGCSDTDLMPKPPWQQRKEAYLAHIPDLSPQVQLVSLADKVHNARCILSDYRQQGEQLWQLFRGGREGTLWYYRSLVEAYRSLPDHPLSGELERLVCELEKLACGSGADA